ncbi:MAG: hypothetical protein J4N93_00160 [Chloroflexi bacterium]|nr:hypothetical protein [Chloroflexota bacterium]
MALTTAEDQEKKDEEKFEFTAEGEALGYISLDQARVLAMRTAREAPGVYGRRFRNVRMAFEVAAEEETEDHYVVTLSFRPQGTFAGTPGQEQFFIGKEGAVEHRQVLDVPRVAGRRFPLIPAAVGLVGVAVAVVAVVVVVGGFGGGGDVGNEPDGTTAVAIPPPGSVATAAAVQSVSPARAPGPTRTPQAVTPPTVTASGAVPVPTPTNLPPANPTPLAPVAAAPRTTPVPAANVPRATDAFAWVPVGNTTGRRAAHTATLLPDGRVLVVGGFNNNRSAELYDPFTRSFSPTGSLSSGRQEHAAALLPDGKVLVVGSECNDPTAELYDPATGTFSRTAGNLKHGRGRATATLLDNGKVLIAGGICGRIFPGSRDASTLGTAELYDPATGTFSLTDGDMVNPRGYPSAILLPNGKVLFIGGQDIQNGSTVCVQTVEIYDPETNAFHETGDTVLTGGCDVERHIATLLPEGKVLLARSAGPRSRIELYDPATEQFTLGGRWQGRSGQTVTALADGRVLIAGGSPGRGDTLDSAVVYDPAVGVVVSTTTMTTARRDHTATLLPTGEVLVIGGRLKIEEDLYTDLRSAELLITIQDASGVSPPPAPTPIPLPTPTTSRALTVAYATGRFVSGTLSSPQITVPVGSQVSVYLTLDATARTTGELTVEIWKDMTTEPDQLNKRCSQTFTIAGVNNENRRCDFVAGELTTGPFNNYFYRVFWDGIEISEFPDLLSRPHVKTNETLPPPIPPQLAATPTPLPAFQVTPSDTFRWPPLGDGQSYVLVEDFEDNTVQDALLDPGYRIVKSEVGNYLHGRPGVALWTGLSLPNEFLLRLRFRINAVSDFPDWTLRVMSRYPEGERSDFDGYIWEIGPRSVDLIVGPPRSWVRLQGTVRSTTLGEWHTFEANFEGGLITTSIDGTALGSPVLDDRFAGGILGMVVAQGAEVDIDDIQVIEKFSWPALASDESLVFEEDFANLTLGYNSRFFGEIKEKDGNRFLFVPKSPSGWGPSEVLTNQRVSFRFKPTNPNPRSFEILSLTTHYSPNRIGRYHVYIWSDAIRFLEGGRPEAVTLASHAVRITRGVWHLVTVTVIDGRFIVTLDGEQVIDHFDDRFESGTTHFQQTEASYYIDDFQLVRLPAPSPLAEGAQAFATPILYAIADVPPDFEDDFSAADDDWQWRRYPDSALGTMSIHDGVMRISGLEGRIIAGSSRLYTASKDFVLQIDARMVQGDSSSQQIKLFFHSDGSNYFAFTMTGRTQSWELWSRASEQTRMFGKGVGEVSPLGQITRFLAVVRGDQGAIYLNGRPVVYVKDADLDGRGWIEFHCLSDSEAVCEFDNVKFWDLANITGLP